MPELPNNWEIKLINTEESAQSVVIEPQKPTILLLNLKKNVVIPEQPIQSGEQI